MSASMLDRRIKIQRAAKPWPPDAAGQPIPAFQDFDLPWAYRTGLSGTEALKAQQVVALEEFNYILHDTELAREITADEQWRVVEGNKIYEVVHAGDLHESRPQMAPTPKTWRALRVRGRAEVAA